MELYLLLQGNKTCLTSRHFLVLVSPLFKGEKILTSDDLIQWKTRMFPVVFFFATKSHKHRICVSNPFIFTVITYKHVGRIQWISAHATRISSWRRRRSHVYLGCSRNAMTLFKKKIVIHIRTVFIFTKTFLLYKRWATLKTHLPG